MTQIPGLPAPPTLEGGAGRVKLDARNSGALWLFNPTLPPPHQKKKKKGKKENPWGTGTPLELRKLLATLLIDGDSDLFLLIVVKITCVPRAFKLWYEGSFHLERGQEPLRPQQST